MVMDRKAEKFVIVLGIFILATSFIGLISPYIFPQYYKEEEN